MPIPALAMFGVSAGVGLLGGLLNKKAELPSWYIDMLRKEIGRDRMSGFVPNEKAFLDQTSARVDASVARLPVAKEQFNAGLASRGMFGGGEAPKFEYSSVYAPIAREVAMAETQGAVGFQQIKSNAAMQDAQMRVQLMGQLGGALTPQKSAMSTAGGALQEAGGFGQSYFMLKALGLV